jgi:DNA-binding response OmpR family regulator
MEPIAIYPDPPPADLIQTLDLAGIAWQAVGSIEAITANEPPDGWTGGVVCLDGNSDDAWMFVRALRKRDNPVAPLLLLVSGAQIGDLAMRDELFEDFCLTPFHPRELEARLRHLLWQSVATTPSDIVSYGSLALNLETYQATIDGKSLDLTYMEYELLKYLAQHPGKVFTREMLLSRVWGYEYYGGARTVDVHVRRLRAKLGEEHASLIDTVRSVGYRFGQSRWSSQPT